MKIPAIQGVIDRRMLVNYRVSPEALASLLPAPFRPKSHRGFGIAGICLIRLRGLRPRFTPSWMGLASENAAHRVAVEWDEGEGVREGVYIPRRDTSSWINAAAGGRVFPGIHSHAEFTVKESDSHFEVRLRSDDGVTCLSVVAGLSTDMPQTSIFNSLAEASAFFEAGSLGYSATRDPNTFQGLELRCRRWSVEPLSVASVTSSFFENPSLFPAGSIHFDSALLMRNIEHEWRGHSDLCALPR